MENNSLENKNTDNDLYPSYNPGNEKLEWKYYPGNILSLVSLEKRDDCTIPLEAPKIIETNEVSDVNKLYRVKNDIKSLNNSEEMKYLNQSLKYPVRRMEKIFSGTGRNSRWAKKFYIYVTGRGKKLRYSDSGLKSLGESSKIFEHHLSSLSKKIYPIEVENKGLYNAIAEVYPSYMVFNCSLEYILKKIIYIAMINTKDIYGLQSYEEPNDRIKELKKNRWEEILDYYMIAINDIFEKFKKYEEKYGGDHAFSFPKMLDDALEMIYLENELLDELDKFKNLSNGYDDNDYNLKKLELDEKLLEKMYGNLLKKPYTRENIGSGIYKFSQNAYTLDKYIFSSFMKIYVDNYKISDKEIIMENYKNGRNILVNYPDLIKCIKFNTIKLYSNIKNGDLELSTIAAIVNLSPPEYCTSVIDEIINEEENITEIEMVNGENH